MIALFFGSNALLEGKSIDDAKERISEAYVPTLIRNWCVPVPPLSPPWHRPRWQFGPLECDVIHVVLTTRIGACSFRRK